MGSDWMSNLRRVGASLSVVQVGLVLVLAHVIFRGWALTQGWFYEDDFEFLRFAQTHPFGWDYLLTPHSGHVMPLGRLLILLSLSSGTLNWTATAAVTLMFQAAVAMAMLWSLITLFGRRWGILIPLVVFLASPITMPATIWWAAALNQLGQQLGLIVAITAWIQYERTTARRWLLITTLALGLALTADIRGLAILPVLAALSFGWFSTGSFSRRTRAALTRRWKEFLGGLSLAALVMGWYFSNVPSVSSSFSWRLVPGLFDSMIGTAFATGIIGGPWRWRSPNPPAAFADPPVFLNHLAWVLLAAIALYAFATRHRTGRAWALLFLYLMVLLGLLLGSRAPEVGAVAGLEYRYLTDAAAISAIAYGLAFMELRSAPDSSQPRSEPLLRQRLPQLASVVLVGSLALSAVWSSSRYALIRGKNDVPKEYLTALRENLAQYDPVDLADGGVPDKVVSPLIWQANRLQHLTTLLNADVDFPKSTDRLGVVDNNGVVYAAQVDPAIRSTQGPVVGCGWPVKGRAVTIPLTGSPFEWLWWMRIGYLAESDTPVTIQAGGTTLTTTLSAGLNNLFLQTKGGYDSVRIGGLAKGVSVCVDAIEIGKVAPGGELQ